MNSGHGPTQDIYRVSWKIGDPYVHLGAYPLNPAATNGDIRLNQISAWASWGAPPTWLEMTTDRGGTASRCGRAGRGQHTHPPSVSSE